MTEALGVGRVLSPCSSARGRRHRIVASAPLTVRGVKGRELAAGPGHMLSHLSMSPIPTLQRGRAAEVRGDFSPCHCPHDMQL